VSVRQNVTVIVERDRPARGEFATEPYECGWAAEAVFFIRKLHAGDQLVGQQLRVQISPDGIRWCDEGTRLTLTEAEVDFVRATHFGNWLRLAGGLPVEADSRVLVALSLKE
jgi:hypothetical protein